jgi:hypothetical protein
MPRGLCIYCGGDVPPVHPADGRCAALAFIVTCPLNWQAASRPSCRRRACPVQCQIVRPCYKVHCGHHHLCVAREASPARQYLADRGCQDARRLLQATPSITSIIFLSPHLGAQHPCTRSPWAIKGEACNVTRGRTHSDTLKHT